MVNISYDYVTKKNQDSNDYYSFDILTVNISGLMVQALLRVLYNSYFSCRLLRGRHCIFSLTMKVCKKTVLWPSPSKSVQFFIPGPNVGLSGPQHPIQPRSMAPHSAGVASPSQGNVPPSHRFPMSNPGITPAPGTAAHYNYLPQHGQAPINLSGPMPPMGNANTPVSYIIIATVGKVQSVNQ